MKFVYIALAATLIASPALAQQAKPDPQLATYSQLLSEANGRIAAMSAQAQTLQDKIDALTAKCGDVCMPALEPAK